MEEQIKNIVSKYIKIPAEQITAQTVIDRSAVASSIILHRMYAQLANEGVVINDYTLIKTFGQLTGNGKETTLTFTEPRVQTTTTENENAPSVGIDTENISSMPVINDFRENAFYKMNFAPAEIAYCILQPNPYASFTGLFAAKEAIIKADNNYKNKPFHTIIIDHLPTGKPIHAGFQISISHTNDTAIAVAVKNISLPAPSLSLPGNTGSNSTFITVAAIAAFLLSLLTLILFLVKNR
ncbi:MAG: 4'-phosphopantetheinyl transferase superfamily protein [Bacteroidota bacterium]